MESSVLGAGRVAAQAGIPGEEGIAPGEGAWRCVQMAYLGIVGEA